MTAKPPNGSQSSQIINLIFPLLFSAFILLQFPAISFAQSAQIGKCSELLFATETGSRTSEAPSVDISDSARAFHIGQFEILTTTERAEISKIISGSGKYKNLSGDQVWESVYEIYESSRLKYLPTQEQNRIRAFVRKFKVSYGDQYSQELQAGQNGMHIPQILRHTPVGLIIRAHEIEHRIQIAHRTRDLSNADNSRVVTRWTYDPFFRSWSERQATMAEWEIVSIIPEEVARHTIEVLKNSYVDRGTKELFLKIFERRIAKRDTYVKEILVEKGYSKPQIFKDCFRGILNLFRFN